jgi:hypothetical protein
MKKYYVYEIVNLMGTVEHVGETGNPKQRFKNHRAKKFKGRQDLTYNIVKEFDNKIDAFDYQCKLQEEYEIITDKQIRYNNISKANKVYNWTKSRANLMKINSIGGKVSTSIIKKCPNCGFEGKQPSIYKHIKNCNRLLNNKPKVTNAT